ncbi:MAG TPA: WD40 repeat domain-containing protein, partial [Myxococcaceae bacterium]|nr:WD40 repeat domain-containing protein [Myxococcaceae bacterium]
DGMRLVVADENAGAKLYDLSDLSKPVAEFGSAGAQQALVSPDGKHLAVRFLDGSAEVYSLQDGKLVERFKRDWPVVSLSWLEGTPPRLAFGLGDDTMRLWDADSRVEQRLTAGAKDPGAELRQQWLLRTAIGTPDGLRTITADGRTHRWTLWGKR